MNNLLNISVQLKNLNKLKISLLIRDLDLYWHLHKGRKRSGNFLVDDALIICLSLGGFICARVAFRLQFNCICFNNY